MNEQPAADASADDTGIDRPDTDGTGIEIEASTTTASSSRRTTP